LTSAAIRVGKSVRGHDYLGRNRVQSSLYGWQPLSQQASGACVCGSTIVASVGGGENRLGGREQQGKADRGGINPILLALSGVAPNGLRPHLSPKPPWSQVQRRSSPLKAYPFDETRLLVNCNTIGAKTTFAICSKADNPPSGMPHDKMLKG